MNKLSLSNAPMRKYIKTNSNVVYDITSTKDSDNCTKILLVENASTEPNKDSAVTYANAEKITVTIGSGASQYTYSVYLDSLIEDGDTVNVASGVATVTPLAAHHTINGQTAATTYTAYVKLFYLNEAANAIANGSSLGDIWNELPDFCKYKTSGSTTIDGTAVTVSVDCFVGINATKSGETVTYAIDATAGTTLTDQVKNIALTAAKEAYNEKIKNISKQVDAMTVTVKAL